MPLKKISTKFLEFNKHRTTEAYVMGFPKAGNTWLQVMLGKYIQLVGGLDEKEPLPLFSNFSRSGVCKRWIPQVPRIQFTHGILEWDTQTSADLNMENVVAPYRGKMVVLLTRTIPDILVSHYWQFTTRIKPPYDKGISSFIRDPVLGVDKAVEFHKLWYEGRASVPKLMLLRYEDLRRDPRTHFRKVLEFWGIPVDEKQLGDAVDYSDFDNMRKLEVKNIEKPTLVYQSTGLPIFATGDVKKSGGEAYHVRKGAIGGYREYMSAEDIEYLRSRMKDRLPGWYGYPDGFEPE